MPVTQRTAPISVYVCVAGGNHSIGSCNRFACIDYCVDSDPLINVSARVTTASGKLRAASITQSIMAAIAQLQNTKMPLALVHAAWVNRSNRTTTNVHGKNITDDKRDRRRMTAAHDKHVRFRSLLRCCAQLADHSTAVAKSN